MEYVIKEYKISENNNFLFLEEVKEFQYNKNLSIDINLIVDFFNQVFHLYKKKIEYVYLLAFDEKCKPKGIIQLSSGTINQANVCINEMFVGLMYMNCKSFFIVHNHPSGIMKASQNDINITKYVDNIAQFLELQFINHIIICKDKYICIKEEFSR